MNLRRGFQRIAFVLIAVAAPAIFLFAYEASSRPVGFRARLLTLDSSGSSSLGSKVVLVDDVGIFYFPTYLPNSDVEQRIEAVREQANSMQFADSNRRQSIKDFAGSMRSKYPEYSDLDDVDLVRRILAKYPIYRSEVNLREFEVDQVYEKRLPWAIGVSALAVGILAVVLFGAIAIISWIAHGFSESRKSSV